MWTKENRKRRMDAVRRKRYILLTVLASPIILTAILGDYSSKKIANGSNFYTYQVFSYRCRLRTASDEELKGRDTLYSDKIDLENSEKTVFHFSIKPLNVGFSSKKYILRISDIRN